MDTAQKIDDMIQKVQGRIAAMKERMELKKAFVKKTEAVPFAVGLEDESEEFFAKMEAATKEDIEYVKKIKLELEAL